MHDAALAEAYEHFQATRNHTAERDAFTHAVGQLLRDQRAEVVPLLEAAALYLVAYTPREELPGNLAHGRHLTQEILAVVEAYQALAQQTALP